MSTYNMILKKTIVLQERCLYEFHLINGYRYIVYITKLVPNDVINIYGLHSIKSDNGFTYKFLCNFDEIKEVNFIDIELNLDVIVKHMRSLLDSMFRYSEIINLNGPIGVGNFENVVSYKDYVHVLSVGGISNGYNREIKTTKAYNYSKCREARN